MARTDCQFNHRMPEALKEMIEAAAKANKRSMTAEVNARLEQSFAASPPVETQGDAVTTAPVLLGLDRKLSALCAHLGVKLER